MHHYFVTACSIIALAATGAAAAPAAQAPKPTEGYDWALRIDEQERGRPAILAYEVPETDDQPLNFSCEEGGGRIFAGLIAGSDDLREITLASGDQTLRVKGRLEPSEIDDMPSFTSQEIAGNAPFITAFAANGWLRMTLAGEIYDMAGTRAGAKAIAAFVAHCNRPYSPAG